MAERHVLCAGIIRGKEVRMRTEDPVAESLQQRAFRGDSCQRAQVCRVERPETPELFRSSLGQ